MHGIEKNIQWLITCLFIFSSITVHSQGNIHQQSGSYEWPEDSLVRQKLEKWRDQKFGIIIHWGLYAVPGIVESWQLCSEDWIDRDSTVSYEQFKDWYWGLKRDFNPQKFNADQWAAAAKDAGMKYVVFTTKHHDGFNMFDTRFSDFKISNGVFSNHPKANVAYHVFESFRKQNFMIGAYYSKPDWHSEYFWWPKYATPDRNVNYDIRRYSWRWNKFKQYTFNQIQELMSDYGKMDILWLDGGWVRPLESVTDEVRKWGAPIPPWSQHIDMPGIAAMSRKAQPGLLIVDRTVHGPYENYQTPEQSIPREKLDYPWESCITLGGAWGYVPNDKLKSARQVIHTLVEVVAKGGNLLLGVGPDPQGLLTEEQVLRLRDIGAWLSTNGEAIYNTRTTQTYFSGNTYFTKGKSGNLYAIVCQNENQSVPIIEWTGNIPKPGSIMKLVGSKETVKWNVQGQTVRVSLPASSQMRNVPAVVFEFTKNE